MPLPKLCTAVNRLVRAIGVIASLTLVAPEAMAQLTLRPIGLDVGAGLFSGNQSGPSRSSTGPIVNALFAWQMDSLRTGALLSAVGASTQGSFVGDCLSPISGGCGEPFPNMHVLSVLAGWGYQEVKGGPALRALLGPALVRAERESTLGLQTRFDLATGALGRVSAIAWLQFLLMPDLLDQRARSQAFGLGLRVQ